MVYGRFRGDLEDVCRWFRGGLDELLMSFEQLMEFLIEIIAFIQSYEEVHGRGLEKHLRV